MVLIFASFPQTHRHEIVSVKTNHSNPKLETTDLKNENSTVKVEFLCLNIVNITNIL